MQSQKIIFSCIFGSHLYGTETPTSDKDYKEVFLPNIESLILGNVKHTQTHSTGKNDSKNQSTDVDKEVFSVMQYLKLLTQGQTVAIDMFFAPKTMITHKTKEWEIIKENKEYLISKNIAPFVGYCYQQAKKYGLKGSRVAAIKILLEFLKDCSPNALLKEYWSEIEALCKENEYISIEHGQNEIYLSCAGKLYQQNLKVSNALKYCQKSYDEYGQRALMAERNEGVDWKSVHHALRVCYQAEELLLTGHITFPLKERKFLTEIKMGLYDYSMCANMIIDKIEVLRELEKNTTVLPLTYNQQKVNEMILGFYL